MDILCYRIAIRCITIKKEREKYYVFPGGKIMKSHAFTLIELMIVVAIVGFLATVSVPQYFQYQAKARQTEVAVNLASLHTAQQAYYAEHGKYSTELSGPTGIGWKPQGYKGGGKQERFYYTYGFNVPGAQEGVHYFTGKLEAPKESLGTSHATESSFVAKAAGNISGKKDKIDIWQVDESRSIENVCKGLD